MERRTGQPSFHEPIAAVSRTAVPAWQIAVSAWKGAETEPMFCRSERPSAGPVVRIGFAPCAPENATSIGGGAQGNRQRLCVDFPAVAAPDSCQGLCQPEVTVGEVRERPKDVHVYT